MFEDYTTEELETLARGIAERIDYLERKVQDYIEDSSRQQDKLGDIQDELERRREQD